MLHDVNCQALGDHETTTQCCLNAVPPSTTLAQH